MMTKPVFPALGAPMSPAWVHGSPRVEELALPKSLKSCNFTLAKVVMQSQTRPSSDECRLNGWLTTFRRFSPRKCRIEVRPAVDA
jgi:hypothetical protein